MKNLKNEKLIFDNAVLSNFARIERLGLISYLSKQLYTTKEVLEEVKAGINRHPKLGKIIEYTKSGQIDARSLQKESSILLMDQLIQKGVLGKGEISAMILAKELNGVFITDDEMATKKALKLSVKILDPKEHRDTVSFLKILKSEGVISLQEFQSIRKLLTQENFIF